MNQIIDLSNFSELKSVSSLTNFHGDLRPLLTIEHVSLSRYKGHCLQGLGLNKMVKIGYSRSLTNVSAVMSVRRVIINYCDNICNWTDLRHLHHLTIESLSTTPNFAAFDPATPVPVDEKCSIFKLELLSCYSVKSLLGLGHIPILIVKFCNSLVSLEGLGNNRVIILESNRKLYSIQLQNYSRRFISPSSCNSGQYILQRK
jgi:hypothetical protein